MSDMKEASYQVFQSMQLRLRYWSVVFRDLGTLCRDSFFGDFLLDVITTETKGERGSHDCSEANVSDS